MFLILTVVLWFHAWFPALLVVAFVIWVLLHKRLEGDLGRALLPLWRHVWPPAPLVLVALLVAATMAYRVSDQPVLRKIMPLTLNLFDMLAAIDRVIAGMPSPVLHRVVARPLDVESATRRIEDLLMDQEEIRWLDALGSGGTIVDVLSTLLALLELAKRGSLRLLQPTPFCPMVIARESSRPAA